MEVLQDLMDTVTSAAVVQNVGWLLIHSWWQCMLIAVVALCLARALPSHSSSARYWMYSLALAVMVIAPVVTMLAFPQTDNLSAANDQITASAELMGSLRIIEGDDGKFIPPVATKEKDRLDASEISKVKPTNKRETKSIAAHFSKWIKAALSPWLSVIVVVWCCGVVLFSIRPFWGWIMVRRLLRVGTSPVSMQVQEALQRVCAKMMLRWRVEVLASTLVGSPIVVGAFRSVILVPASFVSSLPIAQLEAILAHELAHVQRYDYLVNLLQTLVETLFFYHPAVWWLSNYIRIERENCCDDFVVELLDNKSAYGRALLAVEEFRRSASRSSLALSAQDGSLLARVQRLLADTSGDDRRGSAGWIVMGIVFMGLAVTAFVLSNAKGDEVKKAATTKFIAQITDQLSVELLAVKPHLGDTTQAWRPDGHAFESLGDLPAWRDTANRFADDSRHLFFQWKGGESSVGLTYRMPGMRLYIDRNESGLARVIAEPTNEGDVVTVKVGVTDKDWGPWQTMEIDGQVTQAVDIPYACREVYQTILPDHIEDRGNACVFCWSGMKGTEARAQFEVVAITGDGQRRKYYGRTAWDGPNGTESAEVFDVSLKQVNQFEYRLRPYRHWAIFENVSLTPGKKTNVKVSVETVTSAKTASRAGRWPITETAEFEITQKLVHATDVMTSGVIRMQGEKDDRRHVPISIAVDHFANRERWKAVWEVGNPVLWYAKGLGDGPGRILPPGIKVEVEELRRIDFSNPNCIVHHVYSGWAADQLPSADVRAALEQHFEINSDGKEYHRYFELAKKGFQLDDMSKQLFVWVGEHGNCQVLDLAWVPNTGEPEHLKCDLKSLPETLAHILKKFRAKADGDVPIYAYISASPDLNSGELKTVLDACRESGLKTPEVPSE